MSAPYLGDFVEDETVHFMWSTNDSDGASITRATDGGVWVYKDNADGTEVQTGVTDTEDFDSLTGVHVCTIVLTDAFYATGADYTVVLKAATIDGQTVNAVLANFSIENRFDAKQALDTDANGRVRVVIGTGAGELATSWGQVECNWFQSIRLHLGAMYCDAGSNANTIIDADLTPVDPAYDDYYEGQWLTMVGGLNALMTRRISAYDAAATTLTVSPPFPKVNAIGDAYIIQMYGPQAPQMDATYFTDDFILGGLNQQQARDAMKLAPSAGAPAAGSVDEHLDDILADTERIGAIAVTITNAMAQDETITVVRGDDYLVANGRHMVIDLTDAPSLSGGSVAFTGGGMSGVTPIIVDADTIHLEFTAAQTATIDPAIGSYELVLTDASGYIATVVTGQLVSTRSP